MLAKLLPPSPAHAEPAHNHKAHKIPERRELIENPINLRIARSPNILSGGSSLLSLHASRSFGDTEPNATVCVVNSGLTQYPVAFVTHLSDSVNVCYAVRSTREKINH
jgi:hypothetical protein